MITHAHSDHARPGSQRYFCAAPSEPMLRHRLGAELELSSYPYRQTFGLGGAKVSFHPSGHVFGAAQVRVEAGGEVWVVSGDYKRQADPTCEPFEPILCDGFITEATFGLPIFRWEEPQEVVREIFDWWETNRRKNKTSLLIAYTLGKAQRLLAELSAFTDRPVFVHGAIESMTQLYRGAGVRMLPTVVAAEQKKGRDLGGELVLAPVIARGTPWMRRLGDFESGFASGWMQLRGTRRQKHLDRGFVLSDHADWPALLETVRQTGARKVLVTHGYAEPFAHYLTEQGIPAEPLKTEYLGESTE